MLAGVTLAFAAVRDLPWKRVEDAARRGQPRTAIATLDSIATAAWRAGRTPEAIRAIAQRIAFEGAVEGGRAEEKIRRLQAEIAKAPAEARPVMEAILAHWYWEYFRQNRWRFMQRTRTAVAPGEDFTTWDLPRLYAEIDRHFRLALAADQLLQRIPIAEYQDLLTAGTAPDQYRPTLYDFIAFQALDFYSSGEQAGARPEDVFTLDAESQVFAPAETFVRWPLATPDSTSPLVRAVRLYQDLLRFHLRDRDPSAFIDADLWRLSFARNHATGEENAVRFREAMERLAERHANHELSARAIHELARLLYQQGDWVGAWQMARRGLERFPDSVGGRLCRDLIADLEQKEVGLRTDRVWSRPGVPIEVSYRNIDRLHFRLLRLDVDRWLLRARGNLEMLEQRQVDSLLAAAPLRSWSVPLPETKDFKTRVESVPSPADLGPGAYYLVASSEVAGRRAGGVSFATVVWVSEIALVQRRALSGGIEGFVLEAESGHPIAGARIATRVYGRSGDGAGPSAVTDANGQFRIAKGVDYNTVVIARHGNHTVAGSAQAFHADPPRPVQKHTVFFTDRAIYRPGQAIHYKGIAVEVDTERDRYEVLAQQAITVAFVDPNGKEIATRSHRTNDHGSFHGTFEAPQGRLLGSMSIVARGIEGSAAVSVEEYKRPKFVVTMDEPRGSPRLASPVRIAGRAMAYTGAAVNGASVKWRVARSAEYPLWWSWRVGGQMPGYAPPAEIAHGGTVTDAEGRFELEFPARPDPAVDRKGQPAFLFTVSVDVTDPTGETRSTRYVMRLGYASLQATLAANGWQVDDRPVAIAVRTATLDGQPRPASGELVVRRLRAPATITLPRGLVPDEARRQELERRARIAPGQDLGIHLQDDPATWEDDEVVFRARVSTDTSGVDTVRVALEAGAYRARFEADDPAGEPVSAELPIRVLDLGATRLALRVPQLLEAPAWSVEPGQEFVAVWGTGFERGRAFIEVEHRGRILQAFWTEPGRTQQVVRQPVTESMRGGFTLRVTMVHHNQPYFESRRVEVPWSNKRLTVRWERFVSKLEPGRNETWTAVITGPDATRAAAEMVATLYDASLDAFRWHGWPAELGFFRQEWSDRQARLENWPVGLHQVAGAWPTRKRVAAALVYRDFAPGIVEQPYRMRYGGGGDQRLEMQSRATSVLPPAAAPEAGADLLAVEQGGPADVRGGRKGEVGVANGAATPAPGARELDQVVARRALQETAFFFPQLRTNERGEIRLEFTMPEALTRWRFLGFAHDQGLRTGVLEGSAVTAKDLMVQPNPPRFLREGDILDFTVKVSNTGATRQKGRVRLNLADAATGAAADAALRNARPEMEFDVPAGESRTFAWTLHVPDGAGVLIYKAVAASATLSDGEEGAVPVLSRRVLVTESLPLPIRGAGTRTFDFARLRESASSPTLRHQSLTVQMVSNPAWYAVMALPYLMEFPYECSEQVFNRFYANQLGRHIVTSDPRIAKTFERWRGTPALDSPLEKNQDLKAVLLEETPWVRQARSESQARRNVGILFERGRLDREGQRALEQLAQTQFADGSWPWFPGGRPDDYITLYITTGFGRLRHLGADVPVDPALRALERLDTWSDEHYRRILRTSDRKANHLTPTIALYLYGRSFFLKDRQVAAQHQPALDFWLAQARAHWLQLPSRQSQAHLALALARIGERRTAEAIMRSLRERAVTSEELGMFWRDEEFSWWWHRAPIESQAMMIEAFDEVLGDSSAVEACRVWLLKQKQTQDWKTTKATADAVYALLLRGTDVLAPRALVEVALGGQVVRPEAVEAGTGFYERRFTPSQISPRMAEVAVRKSDPGVAWGSVHWQYLEDMSRLTPHAGTPLTLRKTVFVRTPSRQGPRLEAVAGAVRVGQELVIRIELRTDRDMEYVHLKDQRGSGVEPVDVLSGYRHQDGLAYYQTTRDAASHFFIDYLPKGTYVFEYAARVQHGGRYQSGMAEIQCMYAPEFNSHSESMLLEAR